MAVVKRILNLASRYWRDDRDQPRMPVAPMLPRLRQLRQREPYPLSVAEQRLLFSELKAHLRIMAVVRQEHPSQTEKRLYRNIPDRHAWNRVMDPVGKSIHYYLCGARARDGVVSAEGRIDQDSAKR